MTSLSDIGKFTGEDEPKERTSVPVLTGADPVGQLEHQLERRGSFNPLEGAPGVPASLSLGTSNRGDKSRSGPQVVIEGTSEEYDSYDEMDPRQGRESKDSYILVCSCSMTTVITANCCSAELMLIAVFLQRSWLMDLPGFLAASRSNLIPDVLLQRSLLPTWLVYPLR
jgi:hypothetical protein